MTLEPWTRVLMLAGIWGFLMVVLAWGLARWWIYQRRMDQREARLRAAREALMMDLLEPPTPKS